MDITSISGTTCFTYLIQEHKSRDVGVTLLLDVRRPLEEEDKGKCKYINIITRVRVNNNDENRRRVDSLFEMLVHITLAVCPCQPSG